MKQFEHLINNPTNKEIYNKLQSPTYTRDSDPNYHSLINSIFEMVFGEGKTETTHATTTYITSEKSYTWQNSIPSTLIDAILYKDKVTYEEFIEGLYNIYSIMKDYPTLVPKSDIT